MPQCSPLAATIRWQSRRLHSLKHQCWPPPHLSCTELLVPCAAQRCSAFPRQPHSSAVNSLRQSKDILAVQSFCCPCAAPRCGANPLQLQFVTSQDTYLDSLRRHCRPQPHLGCTPTVSTTCSKLNALRDTSLEEDSSVLYILICDQNSLC